MMPVSASNPAVSIVCWFLGCHGGAGVSTLAAAYGSWGVDAGRYWPVTEAPVVTHVVLVARSHARGLMSAQAAVRQWASGQLPTVRLLGLAVVADAPGKLPRPLRELLQLVSGAFAQTWELPWVEALRQGDPPQMAALPRAYQDFAADLRRLVPGQSVGPVPRPAALGGVHG